MTFPIRSLYATDSKSMLDKALKIIAAAKVYEQQNEGKDERKRPNNPFKKAWKLQTDGDL